MANDHEKEVDSLEVVVGVEVYRDREGMGIRVQKIAVHAGKLVLIGPETTIEETFRWQRSS